MWMFIDCVTHNSPKVDSPNVPGLTSGLSNVVWPRNGILPSNKKEQSAGSCGAWVNFDNMHVKEARRKRLFYDPFI